MMANAYISLPPANSQASSNRFVRVLSVSRLILGSLWGSPRARENIRFADEFVEGNSTIAFRGLAFIFSGFLIQFLCGLYKLACS